VTRPIERSVVCAKAAAELARHQQDTALVKEAVEHVRGFFEFDHRPLTLAQARSVLQREAAAPEPPTRGRPGPDYTDLIGDVCQCAGCRRDRGEALDPYDDLEGDEFDDDEDVPFELPAGMPPAMAATLVEEIQKAIRRGESLDEFTARLFAGELPRKRARKRRRR
jgi:hypothetical protein